jgi:hypothetical protein
MSREFFGDADHVPWSVSLSRTGAKVVPHGRREIVDASVTMGANLTLAMGKQNLAAAVVKLSGLCFISEII